MFENTTVVFTKATFNDLHVLKVRINGRDEDLEYWIEISNISLQQCTKIVQNNNDT